jgi:hypothetical protein
MAGVVNWNRPGEMLVGTPTTVQLVSGNDRFVLDNTVKVAPEMMLLKANWNPPFVSIVTCIPEFHTKPEEVKRLRP